MFARFKTSIVFVPIFIKKSHNTKQAYITCCMPIALSCLLVIIIITITIISSSFTNLVKHCKSRTPFLYADYFESFDGSNCNLHVEIWCHLKSLDIVCSITLIILVIICCCQECSNQGGVTPLTFVIMERFRQT